MIEFEYQSSLIESFKNSMFELFDYNIEDNILWGCSLKKAASRWVSWNCERDSSIEQKMDTIIFTNLIYV